MRLDVVAGIVGPTVILVGMLFYSLRVSTALHLPEAAFTVRVTGFQWWWDVRYPDHDIVTANELYVPVGEVVRLELRAADVVHSFWVPNLHGKMDLLPEHPNQFWLRAEVPGVYRGQCAEFCGLQHALMAFDVVALPKDEFERWVAERQRPHPEPADDELRLGQEVFFSAGCNACHAVGGTDAVALVGPDLTHIGTRRTLGAGTVANTRGDLAGWISQPQVLKPGNLMPPSYLEPRELHALVRWLETLR
ncbi:MAG: cytochrome c oxidase subunit II [Planctomycetota bacterium]|nr:cytochrome c oxidase subunit II [Planctomycetota bacterium]